MNYTESQKNEICEKFAEKVAEKMRSATTREEVIKIGNAAYDLAKEIAGDNVLRERLQKGVNIIYGKMVEYYENREREDAFNQAMDKIKNF